MPKPAPTLGIIAGGGRLPAQLIESCQSKGRHFFVIAFENADMEPLQHVPHKVVRIGAVGEAIEHLKRAEVHELVLAGKVKRPSLLSVRPDALGAKLIARMGAAYFLGDDALLKTIVAFLEEQGFRVVGADDVLGGLVTPAGVLGTVKPDAHAQADITVGIKAAKDIGARDVGQAVMVENGKVLGTETADGTDALIEHCMGLRQKMHSGVLVKAKKPGQEARVDLPAIGLQTVEKIHACGFAGIAVEAGGSLILDKEKTIARADALGIFIVGIA